MQSRDIQSGPPLAAVVALLSRCGLPVSDLTQAHLAHFFYAGAASEPDGLIGLEICGSHALLRSLVVSPEFGQTDWPVCPLRFVQPGNSPTFAPLARPSWQSGLTDWERCV